VATLSELAEDTIVHTLPKPGFDVVERDGFVYEARALRASVQRIRLGDVTQAVTWTREESARRGGIEAIEWWCGWHATPAELGEQLLALGLVPDDPPTVTGMTCVTPPPAEPSVEVREIETIEDQLAALDVDWEVWQVPENERVARRALERERFESLRAASAHFAAFLDGRLVGFGRAEKMREGVALMGGAVLPEFRGRGVYRALVHARWEHAAARGTPLLVVQAGPMSAPVLAGLGFESHGELRLYVDRLTP
jgi:GNAT superfamily N-acetyltransferase